MPDGPQEAGRDDPVRAWYRRIASITHDHATELAETVIAAMHAEIPEFADQDESVLAEARHYLGAACRLSTTACLEERRLTTDDIATFPRRMAVRFARAGIPLEAYLKSFRVSQRIFWNYMVDQTDDSPESNKAVLQLNTELVRYTHLVSSHAAQAYLEFQHQVMADADRQRRDLVENLLTGVMPSRRPLLELARAYGVAADSEMVVAVAVPVGDSLSGDNLYMACTALAAASVGDRRTFVAARHDEIVAFAVMRPDPDPRRLCDAFADAQRDLFGQGIPLAVGVSTVAAGVAEVPRGYQEARMALDLVHDSGGITALPLLSPFRYLALRADPTAWNLVDRHVRELLEDDRARGGPLIATIRAFADADLNLRHAAQQLQVHHNTAQYRLRRIQERSGRNPRHIADLLELLVAVALLEAIPFRPEKADKSPAASTLPTRA